MEFASKTDFRNLESYFQITPIQTGSQEKRVQIWFEPTEVVGQYILALDYTEQNLAEKEAVPLLVFPEDIERIIYSYLRDQNQIRIKMTFPEAFNIRPLSFKLLSATKRITEIQAAVHQMNCDLNVEYSPALAIEKTVLIMIVRLLEVLPFA